MKVLIASFMIFFSSMLHAEILLEDDFSDGNADGWSAWTSGYGANAQYTVTDQEYVLSNSGSGWIPAASHNGDQGGIMSTPDYSIVAQITPVNCFRAGILARGYIPSFTGYLLVIIPSQNTFGISKLTSAGPEMITSVTMPLSFNETYWVRFELEGTAISGKIWQGSVDDEPSQWQLNCTNSLYSGPGRMGAFCCNFGNDEKALLTVKYDNISVFGTGNSLDQITWASIKHTI